MSRNKQDKKRDQVKLRKPLKTSAVVITAEDRKVSYSEILAWARQAVKLNEEEVITTPLLPKDRQREEFF